VPGVPSYAAGPNLAGTTAGGGLGTPEARAAVMERTRVTPGANLAGTAAAGGLGGGNMAPRSAPAASSIALSPRGGQSDADLSLGDIYRQLTPRERLAYATRVGLGEDVSSLLKEPTPERMNPEERALAAAEQAAGRPLTAKERVQFHAEWEKAGQRPDTPNEPSWQLVDKIDPADGKLKSFWINPKTRQTELAEGVQPSSTARATGAQEKARGFYEMMRGALDEMDASEDQLTWQDIGIIQNAKGSPGPIQGTINALLLSNAGKRYFHGLTDFVNAKLRRYSGAAVSSGEFVKEGLIAARSWNDPEDVLTSKRQSRERVADALATEAGPAYRAYYGADYEPKFRDKKKADGKTGDTTTDGKADSTTPGKARTPLKISPIVW
jgi:hypothetical protein